MGDRSWGHNSSHGRGSSSSGYGRPRYTSSQKPYYATERVSRDRACPPGYVDLVPTAEPIIRTIYNTEYQPQPNQPPPIPLKHQESRASSAYGAGGRYQDYDGPPPRTRDRSSSGSSSRSRHDNISPAPSSSRYYDERSPRSYDRRSPPRSYGSRSSRSPTRYMNRSPPRPRSRVSPHRSNFSPPSHRDTRSTPNNQYDSHRDRDNSRRDNSSNYSGSKPDSFQDQYSRRSNHNSRGGMLSFKNPTLNCPCALVPISYTLLSLSLEQS
jgi:hypothetical protein